MLSYISAVCGSLHNCISLQVEIRVWREVDIRFISISMENQADVLKRTTQVVNTVSQTKKVMIWMREHIEIGDSHNLPFRAVDEHLKYLLHTVEIQIGEKLHDGSHSRVCILRSCRVLKISGCHSQQERIGEDWCEERD